VFRLRFFLVSFLVSSAGLAALWSLSDRTDFFDVSQVKIEMGEVQASQLPFQPDQSLANELRHRLEGRVQTALQKKIWDVSISELKRQVLEDSWVDHVQIRRILPNRLQVLISPKVPVFLLHSEKNQSSLLTANGDLVPVRLGQSHIDVPILRGDLFLKDPKLRSSALELARALPADGPLAAKNVAEVWFTNDTGFRLKLMSSHVEIRLGEDAFAEKLARVSQILDYLSANQQQGRVIDASFSKKVLVRLRKDP